MDAKVVGKAEACFPLKAGNNPWTVTKKFTHGNRWAESYALGNGNRVSWVFEHNQELHVLFAFDDGGRLFVRAHGLPYDARPHSEYVGEPYDKGSVDPRVIVSVGRVMRNVVYWVPPNADEHGPCRSPQGAPVLDRTADGCWATPAGMNRMETSTGDVQHGYAIPLAELPKAINRLRRCFLDPNKLASFGAYATEEWPVDTSTATSLGLVIYMRDNIDCRLAD